MARGNQKERTLKIYFAGTAGIDMKNAPDPENDCDVLYIKGCEHPEVLNSLAFPDLEGLGVDFAKAIVTSQTEDKKEEDQFAKLLRVLNQASYMGQRGKFHALKSPNYPVETKDKKPRWLHESKSQNRNMPSSQYKASYAGQSVAGDLKNTPYTRIKLYGYSRGAITALFVARALKDLELDCPVELDVREPVPGSYRESDWIKRAQDLTACDNVVKARIEIGKYNKWPRFSSIVKKIWHRLFFSQVVPDFHPSTKVTTVRNNETNHIDSSIKAGDTPINDMLYTFGRSKLAMQDPAEFKLEDEQQADGQYNYRDDLIRFARELLANTSRFYRSSLRSRRKESAFLMVIDTISPLEVVGENNAKALLKHILKNAFVIRGINKSSQSTSAAKAVALLNESETYENLAALTLKMDTESVTYTGLRSWAYDRENMIEAIHTKADKREHYNNYFSLKV